MHRRPSWWNRREGSGTNRDISKGAVPLPTLAGHQHVCRKHCDHGTHVAGIIAGYAEGAHVSAAPQARLFLIKTGVLNKAKDRIEILEEDLHKIYDIIKRVYNREIDRHGERGYLEICAPESARTGITGERPGKRCGFFTAINLSIGAPPGNCGKRAGNLFYRERNFYRVVSLLHGQKNDGFND